MICSFPNSQFKCLVWPMTTQTWWSTCTSTFVAYKTQHFWFLLPHFQMLYCCIYSLCNFSYFQPVTLEWLPKSSRNCPWLGLLQLCKLCLVSLDNCPRFAIIRSHKLKFNWWLFKTASVTRWKFKLSYPHFCREVIPYCVRKFCCVEIGPRMVCSFPNSQFKCLVWPMAAQTWRSTCASSFVAYKTEHFWVLLKHFQMLYCCVYSSWYLCDHNSIAGKFLSWNKGYCPWLSLIKFCKFGFKALDSTPVFAIIRTN